MNSIPRFLAFTASAFLSTSVHAVSTASQPYGKIPERNVFGLKDPKDLPVPTAARERPPRITLTGITRYGVTWVYLTVSGRTPAQTRDCILTVGERDGNIHLLEIDVGKQTAKVNNHGEIEIIELSKDAPAIAAATPAAVESNPLPSVPRQQFRRALPAPAPASAGQDPQSVEEQTLLLELQREELRLRNDPQADLLPPTPLTPK